MLRNLRVCKEKGEKLMRRGLFIGFFFSFWKKVENVKGKDEKNAFNDVIQWTCQLGQAHLFLLVIPLGLP